MKSIKLLFTYAKSSHFICTIPLLCWLFFPLQVVNAENALFDLLWSWHDQEATTNGGRMVAADGDVNGDGFDDFRNYAFVWLSSVKPNMNLSPNSIGVRHNY